jgi:hypothetical protein
MCLWKARCKFLSKGGDAMMLANLSRIQKDYKEDSFQYHVNATNYGEGTLATIGDNWKTK